MILTHLTKHIAPMALFVGVLCGVFFAYTALAASPTGDDWFELRTNTTTGGDNTGDGGTGAGGDLNYYYVGQSINTTMRIQSGGATAANIEVDFDTASVTANSVSNGGYFSSYSGDGILSGEAESFGGGRVLLTGFNSSGGDSSGGGTFGSISWTFDAPTSLSRTTTSPGLFDIYFNTLGSTDESNISNAGLDILDDVEDFQHHVWADIIAPFGHNFSHATGATSVSITDNFTFTIQDSRDGYGDFTESGTGVNSGTAAITFNGVSETDDDSYSCSGTFGSETCNGTVNPDPPSGISGDARNWEYNTRYEVVISNFQDLASASQDQLGEANGPNTMVATSTSFTTETDAVAPEVVSESPTRASTNVATTTNIVVSVEDRLSYPNGPSGAGLVVGSCQFNVTAPSTGLITYNSATSTLGSSATNYGATHTITPDAGFLENETVTVSVYDCADTFGNVITTDTYTFTTVDGTPPYVTNLNPADDAYITTTTTVTFDIIEDGIGLDLGETIFYVNDEYYSDGGGSGFVTLSGTVIQWDDSLDFNGSNYGGDTTSYTPSGGTHSFVLDPEDPFAEGEAVPVIIYTEDNNGNMMERLVYGLSVLASTTDGSLFCSVDTTWNGAECVAVGSLFCSASTTWDGTECVAPAGNTYCGATTTWNGASCVGVDARTYCSASTTWNGTQCVADGSLFCSATTTWNGSECVAPSGATYCSATTTWSGTECVAPLGSTYCTGSSTWNGSACEAPSGASYCSASTTWNGISCEANGSLFCSATTTWSGTECVAPAGASYCTASTTWNGVGCAAIGSLFCSATTTWNGSECIAPTGDSYCGATTTWNGTTCIGVDARTYCSASTTWDGTQCMADGSLFCSATTTWNGTECVAPSGSTYCTASTTWDGTSCVAEGVLFCGDGTIWNGSTCINDGSVTDGGGGGDDGDSSATFAGRAFPWSTIDLLEDGRIVASTVSGGDAAFSLTLNDIGSGDFDFQVSGTDPEGFISTTDTMPMTFTDASVDTDVNGIFLVPTLATNYSSVEQGATITIFGRTVPEADVTVGVASEHETFTEVSADDDGVFLVQFDTSPLEIGEHETRAKSSSEGQITDFGPEVHFTVGDETVINEDCFRRGDLDGDCRVNLKDFSIAAFWYENELDGPIVEKEEAHLNFDGIMDLVDLGIMAFYWTG